MKIAVVTTDILFASFSRLVVGWLEWLGGCVCVCMGARDGRVKLIHFVTTIHTITFSLTAISQANTKGGNTWTYTESCIHHFQWKVLRTRGFSTIQTDTKPLLSPFVIVNAKQQHRKLRTYQPFSCGKQKQQQQQQRQFTHQDIFTHLATDSYVVRDVTHKCEMSSALGNEWKSSTHATVKMVFAKIWCFVDDWNFSIVLFAIYIMFSNSEWHKFCNSHQTFDSFVCLNEKNGQSAVYD